MTTVNSSDLKSSPKRVWKFGNKHVIVIDAEIVKHLGLSEDDSAFEQTIVEGGLYLRLIRKTQ